VIKNSPGRQGAVSYTSSAAVQWRSSMSPVEIHFECCAVEILFECCADNRQHHGE
jgi:hypothetical protein